MPSRTTSARSPRSLATLVSLLVAVVIATAGSTFARQPVSVEPSLHAAPAIGAVEPAIGHSDDARSGGPSDYDRGPALRGVAASPASRVAPASPALDGTKWISRAETDTPAPRVRAVAADAPEASASGFSGRNRVWIPALGIRRSVSGFACTSTAYPGDRVYRWGCAGRNNVYLFGHAHSVFKPLHDAYVRGNLRKGMKVHYADGNGRVSTYRVVWWKVTTPDKGAFAYAAQSRPSMTLQTCVGAKSQYRLIVRLVKAG